jgi:hypothetical protein
MELGQRQIPPKEIGWPLAILGGVALGIWKFGLTGYGEPAGHTKTWRNDPRIDVELEDEWLERLNSIPTIRMAATCAGHPERADSRPWFDYITHHDRPFERAQEAFGDSALYTQYPPDVSEAVREMARAQGKMFVIKKPPGNLIWVLSPYRREELSKEAFVEWWETAIDKVEQIGRKAAQEKVS